MRHTVRVRRQIPYERCRAGFRVFGQNPGSAQEGEFALPYRIGQSPSLFSDQPLIHALAVRAYIEAYEVAAHKLERNESASGFLNHLNRR